MLRTDRAYLTQIREKYRAGSRIWDPDDRWHSWSRRQIERELAIVAHDFDKVKEETRLVVDVGSGGEPYFKPKCRHLEIDLAEDRLRGDACSVCGNAEALPIASRSTDLIICVGPVINYCSLEE